MHLAMQNEVFFITHHFTYYITANTKPAKLRMLNGFGSFLASVGFRLKTLNAQISVYLKRVHIFDADLHICSPWDF